MLAMSVNVYSFQATNEAHELADLAYTTPPGALIKFSHHKRHQLKMLQEEIRHLRRGGMPSNIKLITDDVALRGALEIVQKREKAIHKPIRVNPEPAFHVQIQAPQQQAPVERTQKIP